MAKTDKEHSSFLRYALIATGVFIAFLFIKRDNIITWVGSAFTLRKQEQRIEQLQQSNSHLESQIQDLRTKRDSLERFAREEYYFAAPGEDVYIVE